MSTQPMSPGHRGEFQGADEPISTGISSGGYDPENPPLSRIAENARRGIEAEAAETARMEAEFQLTVEQLAGTLRAVLAERMVQAPTEELDATDALRAARRRLAGPSRLTSPKNQTTGSE